jgi:hypothetical protein
MTVLSDQTHKLAGSLVGIPSFIHAFYGVVDNHDIQQESVLHALRLLEGVQEFG